MDIEGLRFVITGAGNGIGASTAKLAASRGARVVVSDSHDTAGEFVVNEICRGGGEAIYQHCDVTDESQVKELMQAAADAFGGVDVLHNNAGVHESMIAKDISLETMTRETFEHVISINLVGPWLCAKYALPFLKKSSNASIINAGSTSSVSGYPLCLSYGSSKGGVVQLTKNLAVDLAPYNIRVNCYCPGAIKTQMIDDVLAAAPDPNTILNSMTLTHLIPRMGKPSEVAELVCFLASDRSLFVNGVAWLIDGGSLAWRGTLNAIGMQADE
jgi:NAD(P)-dependent dehydrogenase (short-subunit alcohol dehydrogenase family)